MINRFMMKLLVLAILVLASIFLSNKYVPSQHLFWKKINIDAPLGLATKTQLFRLALSPSESCMNLADNSTRFISSSADPQNNHDVCGWTVARHVSGSEDTRLLGATTMQCPLSMGVHVWIKELSKIAKDEIGSELKLIHHFGSYSCRRQNGNNSGAWSEHAFANAWDISAFEFEDGRIISILKHWDGGTQVEQRFLRRSRDTACKIFRVTLSPDYNIAHKDHFHIDMGPHKSCR